MKILCVSPWHNTWIKYWTEFFQSKGYEIDWFIDTNLQEKSINELKDKIDWADCVLCMWADKWAVIISESINKPFFLILRSYEVWSNQGWADLPKIKWDKVTQLFMLNEAHYPIFRIRVKGVTPIFIKNGLDIDEWTLDEKKDPNKVAFICNVSEKKGIELVVQAMHELHKINPAIKLEHIGKLQDIRRWYYLESILPHLNMRWYNSGFKNSHKFVRNFLKDKGYVICTSIAEGHPMNIIEGMATGCIPLIHLYPGAEYQWPKEYLWANFDELRELVLRKHDRKKIRQFIVDNYDYRKTYDAVERVIRERC